MPSSQAGVPGNRLNPTTVRSADMTANMDLDDSHLSGNRLLVINSASALTLTVPDTLTGKEPLTIINKGSGLATIAAGGTTVINSPGGFNTFGQRYGMAVLIPDHDNDNTYWLAGDLA